MKGFITVVQGVIVGFIFLGVIAWQWIMYFLHLGPKPTPQDFS